MPLLYESTEILFKKDVISAELAILKYQIKHAFDKYQEALAEAAKIGEEKGIQMTVESLKPVHFGWTEYKMPVGDTYISLKDSVRFYPEGIFSTDSNFASLKWYEGARTEYLYDWFTKFVYYKEEKSATMFPQTVFKGSFTFSVEVEEPAADVDAWIIGYVVLPATMKEQSIRR